MIVLRFTGKSVRICRLVASAKLVVEFHPVRRGQTWFFKGGGFEAHPIHRCEARGSDHRLHSRDRRSCDGFWFRLSANEAVMLTESESFVVLASLAAGKIVANDMIDELIRRENGTYESWLKNHA